jgi:formylglycine-generating enzyme
VPASLFLNPLRRLATAALVALVTSLAARPASAVTIDWVTVGDPGNAPGTLTFPLAGQPVGAVAEEFRIMKYEWTNSLYVDFLNAVDPDGTNPNGVYNANMGSNVRGGITNTGTTNGSRYAFKANMSDKPVVYLNWLNAARVANWMHNGAQTYGSSDASASAPQNTGAYTLGTGTTNATSPARNADARYFLPSQDQWYKAAYYKGSGTNAGYWLYATQSDTAPTVVNATTVGTGSSGGVSPVTSGNFANYTTATVWGGRNQATTVGTNGGPSAYGTFDMSGNVYEWNDFFYNGLDRGFRGGTWGGNSTDISANFWTAYPVTYASNDKGFRLASLVAVPEPSTWGMGLAGLTFGGWQMWRRRKRA